MTVYLGSQNVGVGIVEKIPAEINNEDIIITENGIYEVGEGYTGFGTVTVNVEGGQSPSQSTLKAINNTGKKVSAGDKLWLCNNLTLSESGFIMSEETDSTVGFISRTGSWGWCNYNGYQINLDSARLLGSTSLIQPTVLRYLDNNSVFYSDGYDSRKLYDETKKAFNVDGKPISGNLFYSYSNKQVLQIDLLTGTTTKTWSFSTVPNNLAANERTIVIGDFLYILNESSKKYRFTDTTIEEDGSFSFTGNTNDTCCPLSITADNRYIICFSDYMNAFYNSTPCSLRLLEVIDANNIKVLDKYEMPVDLQPFYSNISSYITFNPYTGILCACLNESQTFVVMKYENGVWTKISIDISSVFTDKNWYFKNAGITVSDDLTKVCLGGVIVPSISENTRTYVINMKQLNNYAAVSYNPNNITENYFTGIATNDAEPNEEINVQMGISPTITYWGE